MENNESKKELIFNLLAKAARFFDLSTEKTKMLESYTVFLEEYNLADIHTALDRCIRELKFFPRVSEILDRMTLHLEKKDEGLLIAGKIIESIRMGYNNELAVYKEIGHIGRRVVEKFGGWRLICFTEEANLGAIRAQLRELAIAVLNSDTIEEKKEEFKKLDDKKLRRVDFKSFKKLV